MAYFQSRNPLLAGWRPQLREHSQDVQLGWADAAARAVEGVQNSGFLTKIVEVETGSVVGSGLRLACRPDAEALGWTEKRASKWARTVERAFRAWADNPVECDAAGKMTFAKMQQAAFASYKCYGEVLALLPIIKRPSSLTSTRILMLPPSRLMQKNDELNNVVQGVKTDGWGFPQSYFISERQRALGWNEREIRAYDADGRPNVIHVFDASIGTTRGISPLAPVLKVVRQVEQYADATLISALIQTIFAATIKTPVQGIAAFDGLTTAGDTSGFDVDAFGVKKGDWYDGANIDLTQHGRIAHLFPGDELDFKESKQPGKAYDDFMGWLMREISAGAGVTYENATGDYRGATYSSIRMAGAIEWLTVLRRRSNIIVPFCQAVFNAWLEEAIFKGLIPFPGGYFGFIAKRPAAARATWSGPAQPQADDFKAARSHEVLKSIQGTTLAEISSSYGRDWDDDARQRAEENRLHEELKLPLPWAPDTMLQTTDGQKKELEDGSNDGDGTERKDSKPRGRSTRRGAKDPAERDPAESSLQEELEETLGGD